jgi:hypothetical protein
MRYEKGNIVCHMPDNLGHEDFVPADVAHELEMLLATTFCVPGADGKAPGMPPDMALWIEFISSSGNVSQMSRLLGMSELQNARIRMTKATLEFFQSRGYLNK